MTLLLLTAVALAYQPVDGISFSATVEKNTIQITEKNKISYSMTRMQKTSYSSSLVAKSIADSSLESIRSIESRFEGIDPCRPSEYLEIYEINSSELNNSFRFPLVYATSSEVWGYFDPRRDERAINSIVVTPHTEYENYQILTHEVAHHWYSAYCLDEYTSQTSEEFAIQIQHQLESTNDY
jgi:hypothetical protein